ncbi:hypothetical protein INT45_011579 [Circinella minor]|uniref:Peptidase S1 domain-containing protein n=1 Tax=Circinella minor TaxID=1195481 RepID=A0A8H7VCU8_9FUNG|nr:hypothetical protein INT45_011579 [Circinella minor]
MHSFTITITCILFLIPIFVFAIQEGTDVADPSAYPYYVMLGNPHVCGGMIISFNPPIILTAAHCVADAEHPLSMTHNPYFVGYGDVDRKHHIINPIVDWLIHPNYENDKGQIDMHYDIAIIKLQKPFKPSAHVARVALWSEKDLYIPRQAVLMGYGYTNVDKPEAKILQRISVNVTKFTAGYSDMVEAMSSRSEEMACHGDSVALGLLARIFGVYDHDPSHATCPIPLRAENNVPTIIESFCNISNMLKWIADESGITVEQLTDPLFVPNSTCYEDCLGRWKGIRPEEIDEDENNSSQWHIGFGDSTFEKNNPDKWWVGPLVQQRAIFSSDASTSTIISTIPIIRHIPLSYFFSLLLLLL